MPHYPGLRRNPSPSQPGLSGGVGRPANDNFRPGRPANDNNPRPPGQAPGMRDHGNAGRRLGISQGLKALGAGAVIGTIAYEFYEYYDAALSSQTNVWSQSANWEQTRGPCLDGGFGGATRYQWIPTGDAPGSPLCNQAVTGDISGDPNGYPAANRNGVRIWQYSHCPGMPVGTPASGCPPLQLRWDLIASYRKITTGLPNLPAPHFVSQNVQYVPFHPLANPLNDPNALPIGQPAPLPRHIPWRRLSAHEKAMQQVLENQAPYRQPDVNPNGSPVVAPVPLPVPVPLPGTMPLARPEPLPAQAQQVWPVPGPNARPAQGHKFRRPEKGVKERKMKLALGGSAVGMAVNVVTEGLDFLDALYFAIPKNLRRGERDPQSKATAVYRHFLDIDLQTALKNLLVNEVGDRLIGGVSNKLKRSYRSNWERYGLRGGYQLGPAI